MNEIKIHPTAIVSTNAMIDESVRIGAFSIIGPDVILGKNCIVHSHCVLEGVLEIGEGNEFFPFCSIGAPPQDLTYKGERTVVRIGDNNIFREYVSIHRGTMKEDLITEIGSNCFVMAHVHFGHDVRVGNHCIIANSTNFAGHVKLGDRVIIGGGTNISQFVSIDTGAYIGGASAIDRDIPAFCTAYGNRVKLKGINIIGLKRRGISRQIISEVVDFFRLLESSGLSPSAVIENEEMMQPYSNNEIVELIKGRIRNTKVGIAPFFFS